MNKLKKTKSGQAMVEYIIIVVIIAVAVIAVAGAFSDRIRSMFGGAVVELGGDEGAVDTALEKTSANYLKDVGDDNIPGS